MNPGELKKALDERGLTTQERAAEALRVHQTTVSTWLTGRVRIPQWMDFALQAIPKKRGRAA